MTKTTTYTSTELSPERNAAFEEGVLRARSAVATHGLLIAGAWRSRRGGRGGTHIEHNPADTREKLGEFAVASAADVNDAVEAARAAQREWSRRPVEARLAVLERAAALLEERVGGIAAIASLEVGKNRVESVGEVDEAAALIRLYAEQMRTGYDIELERSAPGDVHRSVLRPYGVFAVIAPFNFPLALTCGPSAAALAAGNAVVVKPSPTTSWVGVALANVFQDAGLPDGTFNLVTGGDDTGRALVEHPDIDGIVFTGSWAVGMRIANAFLGSGSHPRPCIIEMGGKNPAIVTKSADLNAAAAGIARSAFALSGQKCSACSRVLVDERVHDELVELLVSEALSWTVADPVDAGCRLGPVHTSDSFRRFGDLAAEASRDGEIAFGGRTLDEGELAHGWYVQPTVVTRIDAAHRLAREELFVPLLVVQAYSSFDEALARANDVRYGLTAGLFSGDPPEIEQFLDTIEAGTVFVNRAAGATSGGWPGQQTYPGWKASGSTGRGALGPRYVEQFLREQGRTIVGGTS